MKKYISLHALVAEIERLIETNKAFKKTWKWKFKWFYRTIVGRLEVLEGLKIFLDTLEVKDVDLNAAVERYVEQHKSELNGYFDIRRIARHFFELGLKTQKGE